MSCSGQYERNLRQILGITLALYIIFPCNGIVVFLTGTLGKQMNNFIEKRQTNTGIVEMCCYNEFGCSIETLSEFCEEGSIHVSTLSIILTYNRISESK